MKAYLKKMAEWADLHPVALWLACVMVLVAGVTVTVLILETSTPVVMRCTR